MRKARKRRAYLFEFLKRAVTSSLKTGDGFKRGLFCWGMGTSPFLKSKGAQEPLTVTKIRFCF